jgi:hypothetical protein
MQGDSVQLYLSIFGGLPPFAYQWSPTEGLTDPTDPFTWASPDTTTSYHMVVTDSAGCTGGDSFRVIVDPTGTDDGSFSDESILLHPNPARDEIMLEIKSAKQSTVRCVLMDLNGRVVFSGSVETNKAERIHLDNLAQGIYIVKINFDEQAGVVRFLKIE